VLVAAPGAQGRLVDLHDTCAQYDGSLAPVPCASVSRRQKVSFQSNPRLVLGPLRDNDMYSGYINVTQEDFLFYWLAEADANVPGDHPLIIWTGGGPGCSAMESAALETGPYILWDVKVGSSMFNHRLAKNAFSWTKFGPVLYVDQPRHVGFSFGSGRPVSTSAEAASDFVEFLRGWRAVFPEHGQRPLIFASDDYGGHLVAAWVDAVLDFNRDIAYRVGEAPFMLRGVALGSAFLDGAIQGPEALREFQRANRLISASDGLVAQSLGASRPAMTLHLGYPPNVYDYRLREQECCGCMSYKYKAWADFMLLPSITSALNVCKGAGRQAFGGCNAGCVRMPNFDSAEPDSKRALGRALSEGIGVMLMYGTQDLAVNYIGGLRVAEALPWAGAEAFRSAQLEPLVIGGVPAGKTKSAQGLTYMQIDGAGHMLPADAPAAVAQAIAALVNRRERDDPDASVRYT